jgi:hypothetical protein
MRKQAMVTALIAFCAAVGKFVVAGLAHVGSAGIRF